MPEHNLEFLSVGCFSTVLMDKSGIAYCVSFGGKADDDQYPDD